MSYLKSKIIFISIVIGILGLLNNLFAFAETLSFVTYYSAPHGAFDRIRFIPVSLTYPCDIGSLSVDQSTNTLKYCGNDGFGTGAWGALNTTWTESSNYIYPTLTDSNPNIFIAIGTSTPEFKLTLDNDGGILAKGTFSSGQTLSDLTVPSENRLIWYPKKAAIRIGTAKGTSWNDSNIGNYSTALGIDNKATGIASVNIGGAYNMFGSGSTASGNYSMLIEGSWTDASIASGDYSTMGTQTALNQLTCSGQYCIVMGNTNQATAITSTVTSAAGSNRATAQGSTVRNGTLTSSATLSGIYSTVGGGLGHKPTGDYSTINGGGQVGSTAGGLYSTIGGGYSNTASAANSTVGGGYTNNASGTSASIAGGYTGQASGTAAVVTGGYTNKANANYATVIGGNTNTVTGAYSVSTSARAINPNTVTGTNSAVMNGDKNSNAGDYAMAIGEFITMNATADHTFYWGIPVLAVTVNDAFIIGLNRFGIHQTDLTATDAILNIKDTTGDYLALTKTTATPGDVFIIKNNGWVGIGKYNPSYPLEFGTQASGAYLTAGGVWTNASSRKLKRNIKNLTPDITESSFEKLNPVKYRYNIDLNEQHLGFIAEDSPTLLTDLEHRSINTLSVTAILTSIIKDNSQHLDNASNELKNMKSQFESLSKQLNTP